MIKIQIDNKKVEVPANTTVLKACEIIGIEISRFCYHEKLSIAGNCRMCLVEIEKSPKPVVSCSMPVMPGMQIFTGTPLVKKARENILEFLLLNHPLDCPVCDQGGECDLQDQALLFGSDRSRFYELKRGVEDKKLGGLIKTIMTRCIHCTRCVRFSIEVAGIPVLGTTLRGTSTEIGTYLEKKFTSELSGNVIDLCPVGALTSKPYAFISRPWELKTEDTIDIFDGVGSNIRVDFKEYKIVRVIPRLQEEINGEWISNKTRFFYDGLTSQRIRFPEIYKDKKWMRVGWGKAFLEICTHLQNQKPAEIAGICSANSDLETQVSFKNLINSFGSENVGFNKNLNLDTVVINNFKPHSTFSDLDKSDWCLLIGLNPRFEASVLNARLRKRYLEGNFTLGYIGFNTNFTYPIEHLGVNITSLRTLKVKNFLNKLKSKQNPLIIIGSNVYKRKDANQIQVYLNFLILKYKKFNLNILYTNSNQIGSLKLGLRYLNKKILSNINFLYLVDIDELTLIFLTKYLKKNCYKIFQGSNSSHKLLKWVDILLPHSLFVEKTGTYINSEGRTQKSNFIVASPGQSQEGWKIFKELSKCNASIVNINTKLKFFNVKNLELLQQKVAFLIPSVKKLNVIETSTFKQNFSKRKPQKISNIFFTPLIEDFYMTDPITNSSKVMAECSIVSRKEYTNFYNSL